MSSISSSSLISASSLAIRCVARTGANPDKWKLLRVILVDKDLNEIKILKSQFPEVPILICYFHVKKYLKEMITKPEFGQISVDDAASVFCIVEKIITAPNDTAYAAQRETLRDTCRRVGCEGFFEYMERNWHNSLDMWLLHRRAHLPHFRNHTNNMLESFGKFKDAVKKDMSMAACVRELLASSRRKENDYKFRHYRLGTLVHRGYDQERSQVLRFTTHFVADEIQPEYAAGIQVADTKLYTFVVDEAEQTVSMQGPLSNYTLSLLDWRCTCALASEMLLPIPVWPYTSQWDDAKLQIAALIKRITSECKRKSKASYRKQVQQINKRLKELGSSSMDQHLWCHEGQQLRSQLARLRDDWQGRAARRRLGLTGARTRRLASNELVSRKEIARSSQLIKPPVFHVGSRRTLPTRSRTGGLTFSPGRMSPH
jgi:uncharacterized protein YukE